MLLMVRSIYGLKPQSNHNSCSEQTFDLFTCYLKYQLVVFAKSIELVFHGRLFE